MEGLEEHRACLVGQAVVGGAGQLGDGVVLVGQVGVEGHARVGGLVVVGGGVVVVLGLAGDRVYKEVGRD